MHYNLHAFFGIHEGKLFVQLADGDNVIAYSVETEVSDPDCTALIKLLEGTLFPDSFKKTGIKVPKITYKDWDGQKIKVSGEKDIIECTTILNIFPNFGKFIFSYIYENGKF